MGFAGGLLEGLINARTGQLQGGLSANERATQQAVQALLQQRAQKAADIENALKQAMIGHVGAQTTALLHPKPQRTVKQLDDGSLVSIDESTGEAFPVSYGGSPPTPNQGIPTTPSVQGPTTPPKIPLKGIVAPKQPVIGSDEWKKAKMFEESIKPSPQGFTIYQDTDPVTGKPRTMRLNTKTGQYEQIGGPKQVMGGAGSAPVMAKVGQFGEMLKKLDDVYSASEGMDVGLGQSASRDIAEHGVGIGSARIPGTQGVGNLLMNRTPQYAQYQAALSPFILAAAHALSGARITQDQVAQIRKSVEMAPGDFANPTVRAQKEKNLMDLVNSIGG